MAISIVQRIMDALDAMDAVIEQERLQVSQMQTITPTDVDAILARIQGQTQQVKTIVPDATVVPDNPDAPPAPPTV